MCCSALIIRHREFTFELRDESLFVNILGKQSTHISNVSIAVS